MNLSNLPGGPLTATDIANLEKSWLDEQTIHQAFLTRVDSHAGAEIVGKKAAEDCAGILFPYVWPGSVDVREFRLRRDHPAIRYTAGKRKEIGKYLSPPGRGNMLYFAPSTAAELLGDCEMPIIITEGEKKTLALWRLAWHDLPSDASHDPRFLPIGLSGVWNFRKDIGREPAPDGGFHRVKGILPDFDRIEWRTRKVIILFDANVRTDTSVRTARTELASHLAWERGAEVYLTTLPGRLEGVNGVDDLLGHPEGGPERVLRLIERARPVKPPKPGATQKAEDDALLEGVEYWQTPSMQLYATIAENGHKETVQLSSPKFSRWIRRRMAAHNGRPPSENAVNEMVSQCQSSADSRPAVTDVHLRVGSAQGRLYVDLKNDRWEAVEITAEGFKVIQESPVLFRRTPGGLHLPTPVSGGSLEELALYCNAGDRHNFVMMVAWLVGALMPTGPYPVLILQGEQGSAKSSTSKVLRSLVDPAKPAIRRPPKDERDLMIGAQNCWVLAFDNLSGLLPWVSDALCCLATGAGFATRELRTDDAETLFEMSRPIILNGIDDIATAPDLMSRALILSLPILNKVIGERRFYAALEVARPRLVGALLRAAAGALRHFDRMMVELEDELPRMADFTAWVAAAAEAGALPFSKQEFLDTYRANRREAVSTSVEFSPMAGAIERLIEQEGGWSGTAGELLDRLNGSADEKTQKSKQWPKDPRGTSNRLRRIAPLLRQSGITVEFAPREDHGRRRPIVLKKVTENSPDGGEISVTHEERQEFSY